LGGPINPAIDQGIVANTYGYTSFGGQSWRMSNAYTDGAFGTWPFSPSLVNEAGETDAQNGFPYSDGSRQKHFEVQWDFASTVPGAEQPMLQISTSPDRGDGARMSFIRMKDLPAGLSVEFVDYQDRAPFGSYGSPVTAAAGCGPEDAFVLTTVASGLSRSQPHTIKLTMDFVDGPRNDVVRVFVDGTPRHKGTSWEDYYRWCTESGGGTGLTTDQSRTVDSMIFQARSSGGTAIGTLGKGFLIDNLSYLSSQEVSNAAGPMKDLVAGTGTLADFGNPMIHVNAQRDPDTGLAKGHFFVRYPDGLTFRGTITCLTVVANTASAGGLIETVTGTSPFPNTNVGEPVLITVIDLGSPGTLDQANWGPFGSADTNCPIFADNGLPIQQGNYIVHADPPLDVLANLDSILAGIEAAAGD
jgi:hypothetical protein